MLGGMIHTQPSRDYLLTWSGLPQVLVYFKTRKETLAVQNFVGYSKPVKAFSSICK